MALNEGYQVLTNSGPHKVDFTNNFIKMRPDAIFFDVRDHTTRNELEALKELGTKIVVLDDSSDRRLSADYVFYPPVPQVGKLNWDDFQGEKYIGWEWVFLNKDFYNQEIVTDSSHRFKKNSLLITMGGVDPFDLSYKILSLLKTAKFEYPVTLVLGSGYQGLVNEEMLKSYANIDLVRSPKNMKELMRQVDFGISAFGVTAYELAALSIPSLLICNGQDDCSSSKIFLDENMALLTTVQNLNSFIFEERLKHLMGLKFPKDKNLNIGSGLKRVYNILWH
jgi:spore coat polysaccharide biosynthesis protein SpsF